MNAAQETLERLVRSFNAEGDPELGDAMALEELSIQLKGSTPHQISDEDWLRVPNETRIAFMAELAQIVSVSRLTDEAQAAAILMTMMSPSSAPAHRL